MVTREPVVLTVTPFGHFLTIARIAQAGGGAGNPPRSTRRGAACAGSVAARGRRAVAAGRAGAGTLPEGATVYAELRRRDRRRRSGHSGPGTVSRSDCSCTRASCRAASSPVTGLACSPLLILLRRRPAVRAGAVLVPLWAVSRARPGPVTPRDRWRRGCSPRSSALLLRRDPALAPAPAPFARRDHRGHPAAGERGPDGRDVGPAIVPPATPRSLTTWFWWQVTLAV